MSLGGWVKRARAAKRGEKKREVAHVRTELRSSVAAIFRFRYSSESASKRLCR